MTNRLQPHLFERDIIRRPTAALTPARSRNGGQWLALVGAALLTVGGLLPVFNLHVPVTLGMLNDGYRVMVLSLAGLAWLSALRRGWLLLALAGLGTYATLVAARLDVEDWSPHADLAAGWLLLILGAMLALAAAAIGEYLSYRDRKPARLDLDFEFPALARRGSLAALQSGWELRN